MPLSALPRPPRGHRARSVAVAAAVALGVLGWSAGAAAAPARITTSDGSLGAQVKAMQATAERVGNELAAGAQKWEKSRARLDVLIQEAMSAQRLAETQAQDVQDAQARVNAVARQAYTHPTPTSWALAMSADPNDLSRGLENIKILDRIGATRQDAVAELVTQRIDSAARAQRAERLSRQAQVEQTRLDAQLEALRQKADAALAELQAAQDRLAQLRAKLRAQEAARLAALRQQQQVLGTCSAVADGSYANGFLPPEMLCPLATAPGQQLARQAAEAFDRMSQAYRLTTGSFLCVTDSYRPYEAQVQVFAQKPSLAATPGRSQHGWGLAVDFCGGIERPTTPAAQWMQSNASAFGWVHPSWAQPGGSRPEPWHWEFVG